MDKKEQIMEAAIDKFASQGPNETTMSEIAKAAGVGKGTIYRYFDDKNKLIYEVVDYGIDKLNQKIKKEIKKFDDPVDKLKEIIRIKLKFYSEYYKVSKFLMREIWGHKDKFEENIKKIRYNHTIIIEEVLKEGIKAGKFKDINVETAATSLIGMVNVPVLHWMMFNNEFPIDELNSDIIDIYLTGFLK